MDRRVAVRSLFVCVVLAYGCQLLFVRYVAEPYPALMMPAFAGTGRNAAGELRARTCDVVVGFADGDEALMRQGELLAAMPSSHHSAMMRWFLPEAEDDEPVVSRFELIAPWNLRKVRDDLSTTQRLDGERLIGMADWLRAQMAARFPGRQPERVTFVWFDEVYRHAGGELTMQRREQGRFAIRLIDDEGN